MEENIEVKAVDYTEEELEHRGRILKQCDHARNQRAQKWTELDDMDYETWYWKAKKANEAYIEPKRNKEDVRVVTGTTREKTNTLVATLLNYNLEADITCFDDKEMANESLAQVMESLVRKSRTLELPNYEEKRPLIYKELIGQGNCFAEEQLIQYSIPEKTLKKFDWNEKVDPRKINWTEKIGKVYSHCNTSVLTGLDVFFGNMREFYVELQPYIIIRRRLSRPEAEMLYGNWVRWENVPYTLSNHVGTSDQYTYNDYQMIQTEVDFIEEIRYFNKWKNEYQILLNGVMMLPVGFPMSATLGVCEYPIAKGDAEPISRNFVYSRGLGAKTKMDQAMMDEMFKMMIVKTRKSFKPPLANKSGYTIGAEVYLPGQIFNNLDGEKIRPIGDNSGVTPSEFNMIQFVKGIIDNKSVSPLMEGQPPGGGATARQIIEQKQQSMIKIGMPMLGVLNFEKRIAWLRIYNILKNWTTPIDKRLEEVAGKVKDINIYRTVDIEKESEEGRPEREIIQMQEGPLPESEQVLAEEDIYNKVLKQKVKKIYIDPKVLASLKYTWNVNIEPTEKHSGMLKAARFEEMIGKMIQMFMPLGKKINAEWAGERMAVLNGENPERVWEEEQPQQPQIPGMPPQGPPQAGGNQLTAQMLAGGGGGEQPNLSLNTLMNQ